MIDFTLSPQQAGIKQLASTFASNVVTPAVPIYSSHATQKARFRSLRPFISTTVSAGLMKAQIPPSLLGTGGTLIESCILVEEIYKSPGRSLALTIFGSGLGMTPVVVAAAGEEGKKDMAAEFLGPFLKTEGEPLASLVFSEPGGVANWLEKGGKGLGTTARKEGDDWIINGEKMWATNSGGWDDRGADLECVVCRYSQNGEAQAPEADPRDAIMVLLLTREVIAANEESAYQVLEHLELPGHSSTSGPRIKYTELRVPGRNLLAAPGTGATIIETSFTISACLVGAMATGIMSAAFEAALAFAKSDSRGGAQALLTRQSVSDLLMEVKMKTDAARLLTWKAAHALENGKGGELAYEAKIYCSDLAVKAVVDAMSAVGMSSYNKETVFPQLLDEAMCLALFDGGNVGVRRRQLEKIMAAEDYQPWGATYGQLMCDSED